MKLTIKDKRIVCEGVDRDSRYWQKVKYEYFYASRKTESVSNLNPIDYVYERGIYADHEYGNLCNLIDLTSSYGVSVDEKIYEHRERLKELAISLYEKESVEREEAYKRLKWESICKFGCGRCHNLAASGDDYICKASGEDLGTKQVPHFNGMSNSYHLFYRKPFPSANCPMKTE